MTITTEQFNTLATKDDLEALEEKLPTREQIDNLSQSVEKLATAVDTFRQENAVYDYRLEEVEKRIGITP